uniref:Holin n=1 Tax=viral metagenome TaxID=1070528 RepID=A0A6M3XIN9_9ZZZZ
MDLTQIGIGALAGIFVAGAGYLKSYSNTGDKESFDGKKFASTIVLGGLVGLITTASGQEPSVIEGMLVYMGITGFVENIFKGIKRGLIG